MAQSTRRLSAWRRLRRAVPSSQNESTNTSSLIDEDHGIVNGRSQVHSCPVDGDWDSSMQDRCASRLVRALNFNFREIDSDSRARSRMSLPKSKAVTKLLIRRQYYRDIATPALLKLLSESLTCVESLRRENWRIISNKARRIDDRRYTPGLEGTRLRASYLLGSALPTQLKSLHLFEDFHPHLHGRKDAQRPRSSKIQILPSLAISAPSLEHLSVSFLPDAIDCLGLRDHLITVATAVPGNRKYSTQSHKLHLPFNNRLI